MPEANNIWPGDKLTTKKRLNVVEFYHQILWTSQQCEEKSNDNIVNNQRKRVSFSAEPPIIYEYEPEYKSKCDIFVYHHYYFRRGKKPYQQEKFVYSLEDKIQYPSPRLINTRSLTDFNPKPNAKFNNTKAAAEPSLLAQIDIIDAVPNDSLFTETPDSGIQQNLCLPPTGENVRQDLQTVRAASGRSEPPSSYVEHSLYSVERFRLSYGKHTKTSGFDTSPKNENGGGDDELTKQTDIDNQTPSTMALFQRTLRKIKPSSRLMFLQGKFSMPSPHKKSFPIL